jgi:para-nitrobenzyl esterase
MRNSFKSAVMGLALVFVTLAGCSAADDVTSGAEAISAAGGPTVHTTRGDVAAQTVTDSIALFRDVPYAAPPVGALRFMPPAVHEPWTGVFPSKNLPQGVFCAPTIPKGLESKRNPTATEDCLYLDVYAPATKPEKPLPVLFYLHGGFGLFGSKASIDGSTLAKVGNVIVVSANYRLGALGYLAHPKLTAEQGSSGNYAHLDQIAALQWVRDNIAAFGGDPKRVTLSGQSWGGQSACILMASPLAKGLFSSVFDISGVSCETWDQDTAFSGGAVAVKQLGCDQASDVPGCLRKVKVDDAQASIDVKIWSRDYRWRSTVDGHVLPDKAQAIFESGQYNKVPVMKGTTSREASVLMPFYFPPTTLAPTAWDEATYEDSVKKVYGDDLGAKVLAQYPASSYPAAFGNTAPSEAMIAVISDERYICATRRVARKLVAQQAEPIYRYVFGLTGDLQKQYGTGHAQDLPFIFHNAKNDGNAAAVTRVEDLMAGYVSRFVATHDPNGGGSLNWPKYTMAAQEPVVVFDDPARSDEQIRAQACDFWDSVITNP